MKTHCASALARGRGAAGPLALVACAALVGGCSSTPATHPNEAEVREFAAKGYASAEHVAARSAAHTWLMAGHSVHFNLSEPDRPGLAPLVVYLPGLGEPSDAGAKWRAAWSLAGYAVLSVQALEEDALAWTSEQARAGEFRALGRERYAAAATARRLQATVALLEEAQRRSRAGEAGWQRIDWGRVAVAGFDLGAHGAMALAGEHVAGTEAIAARLNIRAAVVLSPYASVADGALDTRWHDIRVPVLSVTSDTDGDVLGLVDSVALRGAPFEAMPGPDKYLLSLRGLPHAGLGGNEAAADSRGSGADSRRTQDSASKPDGDSGHRRGGRQKGTSDASPPVRTAPAAAEGRVAPGLNAGTVQMRVIAAQDVSTAFLDAYVKGDPLAREWLTANAPRWLGAGAVLRSK